MSTSKPEQAIRADMTIAEIVQQYPDLATVLAGQGMGCMTCMGAVVETLAEGAMMHNLDIDGLLDLLNAAVETAADASS